MVISGLWSCESNVKLAKPRDAITNSNMKLSRTAFISTMFWNTFSTAMPWYFNTLTLNAKPSLAKSLKSKPFATPPLRDF